MKIEKYDFNYNVSSKTWNCINAIDFTYHIGNFGYPALHLHTDYFEFTIIIKGAIENYTNNEKRFVDKGNLLVTLSNVDHYFIKKSDELYFINIICRNKVLKELSDFYGSDLEKLFKERVTFNLSEDLIYRVKSNIDYVNSSDDWEQCNSILRSTIIEMVNYIYLDSIKSNYNGDKWEITMNNLKQHEEFYTYNVNQLCEVLGYSRTQLNRLFMEKYGVPPHEYLIDLKMRYALSLLCYTDFSIAEITSQIGFKNQNQFNKLFKEKYNKNPLDYRKKR